MKGKKLLIITVIIMSLAMFGWTSDLKWRSDVELTPASPNGGDSVNIKCRLKSGDAASTNVQVQVKMDGSTIHSQTIASLALDEFYWVDTNWTAVAGSHTVEFIILPGNPIDENPANNTKSKTFTVGPGGGDPGDPGDPPADGINLIADKVYTDPVPSSNGTPVTIKCDVKNNGTAASGPYKVRFFVQDTLGTMEVNMPSLAAGATATANKSWTSVCKKYIKCRVDSANAVTETNETDNEKQISSACLLVLERPPLLYEIPRFRYPWPPELKFPIKGLMFDKLKEIGHLAGQGKGIGKVMPLWQNFLKNNPKVNPGEALNLVLKEAMKGGLSKADAKILGNRLQGYAVKFHQLKVR